MKQLDKKRCQKIHFKKRFFERTKTKCSRDIYNDIIFQIVTKKLSLFAKQSSRVSLYEYSFNRKDYIIAYDKYRETLISIFYKKGFRFDDSECF